MSEKPIDRTSYGLRIGIGVVGLIGILWGLRQMSVLVKTKDQISVVEWAFGSDVLTDGVFIPLVILVGWLTTKLVKPRARRYVQGALIAGAAVTLIAIPLIYRRGKEQPGQALLQQNYGGNLAIILGVIAAVAVGAYAYRFVRDARSAHEGDEGPA